MQHNKQTSNSPFYQNNHLYLGSPTLQQKNSKKNQGPFNLTQGYVPAININLKNQLSINLMNPSKIGGSISYREMTGNTSQINNYGSDASSKLNKSIRKPQPVQYYHNHSNSHESNKFSQSQKQFQQVAMRGSMIDQQAIVQPNQILSSKQKPKSMDQSQKSVTNTSQPSKAQASFSKMKVPTEPSDLVYGQLGAVQINSSSNKNTNNRQNAILNLIMQKLNSKKQSLNNRSSPQHSEALNQNFKKLLNDYNQILKGTTNNNTNKSKEIKKNMIPQETDISGYKTERNDKQVSTLTVQLYDSDSTVTEFKFDSQYGSTEQLFLFLLAQVKESNHLQKLFQIILERDSNSQQTVIGFRSIDQNIPLDYYLSLKGKELIPLQNLTLKLQPVTSAPSEQISLKCFQFLQCVGMGGFSRVYLVRSKQTGHYLALKLISKQFIIDNQKQYIVQNERDVMVQLTQSRNMKFICKLECAFESKSWVCFGMEYCPGGELFNQLRKVKRMNEDQARIYFIQVCAAVAQLHDSLVLYRDIKPENILIDENGFLKLADFGLARPNMTSQDEAYSFCGSPEYMAPEMLQQQGHTYAVDYYCLGALLYELLTGLPPFYSRDTNKIFQSILYENLQFPQGLISNSGRDLIKMLLHKNPAERLGVEGGVYHILQHPWLKEADIEAVLQQKVKPPFPANLTSFNFDPSEFKRGENIFKQELLKSLTSPEEQDFKSIFKNFNYVGPNLIPNETTPLIKTQNNPTRMTPGKGYYNSIMTERQNDDSQCQRRVNSANNKVVESQTHRTQTHSNPKLKAEELIQQKLAINPKIQIQTQSQQQIKKTIQFDRNTQISNPIQSRQSNIQKRLQMQTSMRNQHSSILTRSLATEPNDQSMDRVSFMNNGSTQGNLINQEEGLNASQRVLGKTTPLMK